MTLGVITSVFLGVFICTAYGFCSVGLKGFKSYSCGLSVTIGQMVFTGVDAQAPLRTERSSSTTAR
ncbi:hypothetical protein PG993_009397 [Apiospora rasikravindrae]|uniref:Uncharacterized protein n=1 Tax=Apiospora rasikravindrae TaxID=990691 RepID=A0ABR1SJP9_9PEZI